MKTVEAVKLKGQSGKDVSRIPEAIPPGKEALEDLIFEQLPEEKFTLSPQAPGQNQDVFPEKKIAAAPAPSGDQDDGGDGAPSKDPTRPIFFRKPWNGPWISTDRNSVTPHPNTVPQGYLQVENGMSLGKLHVNGFFNVPETLVRLGILENTELRFTTPNYFYANGRTPLEGTNDITLAFKHEMEPDFCRKRGLDIGVIAGTSMPTGSHDLTIGKFAPFVQIITFQNIGTYTLSSAQSMFIPSEVPITIDPTDDPKRFFVYQPTAQVWKHFGQRVDIWMEYAGDFFTSGDSLQLIDFGALYRPVKPQQVDFRFGFGLSDIAPRAFINFGYSVLVGKLSPLR